jgi:hypothetical protein
LKSGNQSGHATSFDQKKQGDEKMSKIKNKNSQFNSNRIWLKDGISFLFVMFMVLTVLSFSSTVRADEYVSDEWRFSVAPYMWLLALDSNATVMGQTSQVDMSFSDIWDSLDIAFMGDIEARKGRFGFFVNGLYSKISDQADTRFVTLKANVELDVVSFGAFYRLGPHDLKDAGGDFKPTLVTDLIVGGRYTYAEMELFGTILAVPVNAKGDRDWLDPIIGLRTFWALSPKWNLVLAGDIGGFGVGSDFQWAATALLGYSFHFFGDHESQFYFGYRIIDQDYEDGSGINKFAWDATLKGPVLGLAMHF